MKLRTAVRAVPVALALLATVPASAQIISTSIPVASSGDAQKKFSLHVMGGYTYFHLPVLEASIQGAESGTHGAMFAAEAAWRVAERVDLGVGGWYNDVGTVKDLALSDGSGKTLATGELDINAFAVYGNLFVGKVGIQAGVVRPRASFEMKPREASSEQSVTDFNGFLSFRHGGTTAERRWNVALGAGIYRTASVEYFEFIPDSDPSNLLGGRFEERVDPATVALSVYATASVGLVKGLSVDVSAWYVGGDTPDGASALNSTRLSIGLGYTF